jgi:predicted phosphodiesterase
MVILEKLRKFRPLKAVYGNIDGTDIRISCPLEQLFDCEEVKVYMIHIGGYPGNYNPHARKVIESAKPGLFVSGHSHILKVIYDKRFHLLHINPGAAGNSGLHNVVTIVRFSIDGRDIRDLEISEAPRHI